MFALVLQILTGQIRSYEDIPEGDVRKWFPRFQPDVFHLNLKLFDQVQELAKKHGSTPAQLAINWVRNIGKRPGMPTIIPIPGATTAARVEENSVVLDLTEAEMKEIDDTSAQFEVHGARYPPSVPHYT